MLPVKFIFLISFFIVICYLIYIDAQETFGCKPVICMTNPCPRFKCKGEDKKTYKNATKCGCCHICVDVIKENAPCVSEMSDNTPPHECGPHLYCSKDPITKKSFCKKYSDNINDARFNKKCEIERQNSLKSISGQSTGPPPPECDEFGDYAPKRCKNGTLCHCVNKNGDRIFGESTYSSAKDMNCLCARQYDDTPVEYRPNPVNFVRCKPNGNFEPFQTINSTKIYNYCINETDGTIREKTVLKAYSEKLPCFKHYHYEEKTKCIELYLNATGEIKKLEEKGKVVVGYDVPQCDLDGSYQPVQCKNNTCFCVDKSGKKYPRTEVARDSEFALNQTCNCVRELEMIRDLDTKERDKVSELFIHYRCDKNGNYLPFQCAESVCYCVDQFGYQRSDSKAILKSNVKGIIEDLKICFHPRFKKYFRDISWGDVTSY